MESSREVESLIREINNIIQRTLGSKASEEEKKKFTASVLSIFRKQIKNFNKFSGSKMNNINYALYPSFPNELNYQFSPFNTYFTSVPYYPQYTMSFQNPTNYSIPYIPYFLNYQPFQSQMNVLSGFNNCNCPIKIMPNKIRSRIKKPKAKNQKNAKKSNQDLIINRSEQPAQKDQSAKTIPKKIEANLKCDQEHNNRPQEVQSKIENSEGPTIKTDSNNNKAIDCPNGIFEYLRNKTNCVDYVRDDNPFSLRLNINSRNLHDNGTVEVTSNSICSDHPKIVLIPGPHSSFLTDANNRNVQLMFDFKNIEVCISSYLLKSGPTIGLIRNWSLEVSNDKCNWTVIDNHIDDSSLSQNQTSNERKFNTNSTKFARYARFLFTDILSHPRMANNYAITIQTVEFYGSVRYN